jgi:hypothetical protein
MLFTYIYQAPSATMVKSGAKIVWMNDWYTVKVSSLYNVDRSPIFHCSAYLRTPLCTDLIRISCMLSP